MLMAFLTLAVLALGKELVDMLSWHLFSHSSECQGLLGVDMLSLWKSAASLCLYFFSLICGFSVST